MPKRVKDKDNTPMTAPAATEALARQDGWENLLTKVGNTDRDKRTNSTIAVAPIFQARQELEELFHGNDLANRICSLPANEMLRAWIDFEIDDEGKDPEEKAALVGDIMEALDTLKAKSRITEAKTWARLFGGAAIWVGANDGLAPDQPLNIDNVRSVDWLTVYDRHEIMVATWVEDPLAADFGEPELYQLITVPGVVRQAPTYGTMIHASRILHFDGAPTTRYRRRHVNRGWGDSIFVKTLNVIRAYDGTWDAAEILMQDFAQAVIKIKGLAEMMAANGEKAVMDRLELLDVSRSILRAMVIDAEHEDFTRQQTPMTGLPDLLDRWLHRVSAAAEMPITVLFGMSPGGMNATGESDTRNWYDGLKGKQEAELREPIEKLLEILLRAKDGPTSGVEPAGWSWYFCPLWQMSDTEKATLRKTQADTDAIYIDRQVLSVDEVAMSHWGGGEYTPDIKLDLEARAAMGDAVAAGEATPMLQPGEAPHDIRGMTPEQQAEADAKAAEAAAKAKGKAKTDSAERMPQPRRPEQVVFKRDADGRIVSAEIAPKPEG